jgi:UDP-N-acetylglucosamine 4,6-dehydratase
VAKALELGVKQIRVYSRDELKQHEMRQVFRDPRVEFLLGDVRDFERLKLAATGCDVLVHAAAIKRIEKAERDPEEAIKTNIQGSINAANAALFCGVEHAILISTDKACEPINLYGATKMVAEKYWIQANGYRGRNFKTKYSVVRYGNVIGSRGSVIPAFKKQAQEGSFKVTHQDMTRFLIGLDQAIDLVYCAFHFSQGGEIYLPILKAAKITDIAKAVDSTVPIEFVGMGEYEKLHEQLFNQSEANRIVLEDGYMVIEPDAPTWPFKKSTKFTHIPANTSEKADRYDLLNLGDVIDGK